MKLLLLHPEDSPLTGPWMGQRWDAVFDLGRGGWAACERWERAFGCPVKPIDGLRDGYAEMRRIRELLRIGMGHLVDKEGLDWWELTAIFVYPQLATLILLRKFVDDLPHGAEVWISRDGFEAEALRLQLGSRLHVMSSPALGSRKGLRHYLDRLWRLPAAQVIQVVGDKYDAGYRVRQYFHPRARGSERPVVLLPSSYVNMSLTGTAYARLAPDTGFLLVSTRRSGRLREVPANVRQAWLASYAGNSSSDEHREIVERWAGLKREIESAPELAALTRLGLTDNFPCRFADGLAIRNAWLRVLNTEPVHAVLCCDDGNPHTHIPLLLAGRRGIPTIACHHGALDGGHLFKRNHADVILAKGKMEHDYLVQTCGVDPSVVEIGAPSAPVYTGHRRAGEGDSIVFFSEPYEMTAGRGEEIYRDVVPGMAELSERTGKKLVVKLHPSENLADRRSMTQKLLTRKQAEVIHWETGPLVPELLEQTWFGLTVQSSVAMECVVHGVPCYLCDWMNLWPNGYVNQYRKFGVGIGLGSPEEIARIPEILATYHAGREVADACWQAISPQRLDEILAGSRAALPFVPAEIQRA